MYLFVKEGPIAQDVCQFKSNNNDLDYYINTSQKITLNRAVILYMITES